MKRTRRKTLLFVGLECVIVILLSEVALRVLRPARAVGISHLPCIYLTDARNGYRYKPNSQGWYHRYYEVDNTVVTNSAGFHDIEHPKDDPGLRVVAIGDSFTAGMEVPIPNTWTQVLQRELRDGTKSPVHVLNLGMTGTGTDVHRDVLKQYLQCGEADLVILAFCENDLVDMRMKRFFRDTHDGYVLFYQDEDQKRELVEYLKKAQFSPPARWLYRNSYSARIIMNRMSRSRLLRKNVLTPQTADMAISEYDRDEWHSRVQETFRGLIRLSRQHDFILLVVPVPGKERPLESMNVLLENVCQDIREELDIIDVLPRTHALARGERLDHSDLYWRYDHHFNTKGHRIFGTALAEALREGGWLSSRVASPDPDPDEFDREVSSTTDGGTKVR